jgi:hypothetical protein
MPDSTKTGNGTHDANMLKANHDWQIANRYRDGGLLRGSSRPLLIR